MEYTKKSTHEEHQELAKLFSMLANPLRLKILSLLIEACADNNNSGLCVQELNDRIDVPQPYLSKHLRILEASKVLVHRRDANKIYYTFAENSSICRIFDFLGNCCDRYNKFADFKPKTPVKRKRP